LVFICYLFDRKIIVPKYLRDLGIDNADHLRDVLKIQPATKAKAALYKLFQQLRKDFNGDLFSDDLTIESEDITSEHIRILSD
jgi:hypothetical protein